MKWSLIIVSLILIGCDGRGDCSKQISDTVGTYGNPEEVVRYDAGSYHVINYWYWSQGFEYTFTWDTAGNGFACEVSLYQFTPIDYHVDGGYTYKEVIDGELVLDIF